MDINSIVDSIDRGELPEYQAHRRQGARALAADFCMHYRRATTPSVDQEKRRTYTPTHEKPSN